MTCTEKRTKAKEKIVKYIMINLRWSLKDCRHANIQQKFENEVAPHYKMWEIKFEELLSDSKPLTET